MASQPNFPQDFPKMASCPTLQIAPEHMPYSQKTSFPTLILIVFFYVFFWCNSDKCFVWMKFFRCFSFHPKLTKLHRRDGSSCWIGSLRRNTSFLLGFSITTTDAWNAEVRAQGKSTFDIFFSFRLILDWQSAKDRKKVDSKKKTISIRIRVFPRKIWNHSEISMHFKDCFPPSFYGPEGSRLM